MHTVLGRGGAAVSHPPQRLDLDLTMRIAPSCTSSAWCGGFDRVYEIAATFATKPVASTIPNSPCWNFYQAMRPTKT